MENYILLGVFLIAISVAAILAEGVRRIFIGIINKRIKKNLSKVYPPINMNLMK